MLRLLFLCAVLLSTLLPLSAEETASFQQRITNSLTERDSYYNLILGEGANQDSLIQAGSGWKLPLSQNEQYENLWFHFLSGLSNPASESLRNQYYQEALNIAQRERGDLIVLMIEFLRVKEYSWAKRTVDILDREYVTEGISANPLLENQIVLLASQAYNRGDKTSAARILDFAYYFTTTTPPLILTHLILGGGTFNTDPFMLSEKLTDEIKNNAHAQIYTLNLLLRGFLALGFVIAFISLFTLIVQNYTRASHFIVCKFPHSVPFGMRTLFTAILIGALIAFGLYPILLVLLLYLTPYVKTRTMKTFAILGMVLLFAYPVVMFFYAHELQSLSEKSPIGIFNRALTESPEEPLVDAIPLLEGGQNLTAEQKALLSTSVALAQLKLGDIDQASSFVDRALDYNQESEPTLLAAGMIYFGLGDYQATEVAFTKAVEKYPLSPVANFNHGQFALMQANTLVGNERIATATTAYPSRFNVLLDRNSKYFGNNSWPLLRQFVPSDLSSQYYWKNREALEGNLIPLAKKMWGGMFFGIDPFYSWGVIFLIFLFRKKITQIDNKKKKITPCSLCGKPTCRNCRDEYCNDCHASISPIANPDLINSMKIKIANGKKARIRRRGHFANLVVPGTKNLHLTGTMKIMDPAILITTIVVYTGYLLIWSSPYTLILIPTLESQVKWILTTPLLIYNLVFLIGYMRVARKEHMLGKK